MEQFWLLITTSSYFPFTVTFFLMIGIGFIEAIGLGVGALPDVHVDIGIDCDVDSFSLLDWLGIGSELPILIWLTSLLACFTVSGFILQQIWTVFEGSPASLTIALPLATLVALFLNFFVASGLYKIIPKEETSAINPEDLLGSRGVIINSSTSRGRPSRAKVVDHYGQAHYVMIEPHDDDSTLKTGETVLLVRKNGSTFFGQPDTNPFVLTV